MFENLIRKNLDLVDLVDLGTSYVAPKPIFSSGVKNALHCVLTELLSVATGDRVADERPVALKKFEVYFVEAWKALDKGLVSELLFLNTVTADKESGVRLACFIDGREEFKYMNNFLKDRFRDWLIQPKKDKAMVEIFLTLIKFNEQLSDKMANQLILEAIS